MESFDSIGETEATEFLTTAQGHRKSDILLYEINALKVKLACACSKAIKNAQQVRWQPNCQPALDSF
jgi:hypothetical protein